MLIFVVAPATADGPAVQKEAIVGALALYLDFVNLFLYLVRIFGRRR
jgi:FtsH-binding integral membrane protein